MTPSLHARERDGGRHLFTHGVLGIIGVVGCLLAGVPVSAVAQSVEKPQEPAPFSPETPGAAAQRRPYRGLFGGDGLSSAPHTLDLRGSLFGAYDDNVFATVPGGVPVDPRVRNGGYYTGANAAANYAFQGDTTSITATGAAAFGYYRQFADPLVPSYNAGVGLSTALGARTRVHASQSIRYSPFLGFTLFPSLPSLVTSEIDVTTPTHDYASGALKGFTYGTTAELAYELSRRASFAGFYDLHRTEYNVEQRDLAQQRAGVRFHQQLSGHAGLRLGYAYRTGRYGFAAERQPVRSHDLDVGIDYGRALSFSRRTVVSFGTGSSILMSDPAAGQTGELIGPNDDQRTHFFVSGFATVNHEIGRTWAALGSYVRSIRFEQAFSQPLLTDAVSARLAGQINQRLTANFNAGYSFGSVGPRAVANGYDTFSAVAHLQAALSRHFAAYTQYVYYHYNFGYGVQMPPGFARGLDRNGMRAGLTVWTPLLRSR